jgi:hypothetical protein
MTCKDCDTPIGYEEHRRSLESLGVELCEHHARLMERIIEDRNTPIEAIQLFYALKEAGARPMLEWWDGYKSVDIAFSRVKLNIEVDVEEELITPNQAIRELNEAMHSFKKGFTTIRIPKVAIRYRLEETVENILGIIEGLRQHVRVI